MSVFKVLLSFNVLFYKAEGKVYLLVTRDKITESKLGFDYEDYTIPGNCGGNGNPIANLESALRGYNVVQGNQFFPTGHDPGLKDTIFKGTKDINQTGEERCISKNIIQYENTICKKEIISKTYRTYQDYQEAKSGSVVNSDKVSSSISAGGLAKFIASFEASASSSHEKTSEFSKAQTIKSGLL